MAIAPALTPNWWLRHYPKVSFGLGASIAIYYFSHGNAAILHHTFEEYFSFITLIGALFVVAGGIHLEIPGASTPSKNVVFLLLGALVANLLGTTGAAILLIRPWLRFNRQRLAAHHVVFFIFLVANIGGCLTPIGDPPLFLGFLEGVPFSWVAKNCWPMWTLAVSALLAIFYVIDKTNFSRSPNNNQPTPNQWRCAGAVNLFFLTLILGAVFIKTPLFLREFVMLAAAIGSYFLTSKSIHAANQFNFHPLKEIAILFAGIFITMIPALAWLNQHAATFLGTQPSAGIFFWGTGILSSVLDNAPTYLGFLGALAGATNATDTNQLLATHSLHVLAISIGAVFFGAFTYIGNGPNLMVKALAEQSGAATPSFFGYILKFSLPFLLPVLGLVWWLYFRD